MISRQRFLVSALLVAAIGSPLVGAEPALAPWYFASPAASVPRINELLRAQNWPTLARYYDLAGSGVTRSEAESEKFFLHTEPPASPHPAGLWKYRQPFAPGHQFLAATPPDASRTVTVTVELAIDQGGGPAQRTRTIYRLRESNAGYQLLPNVDPTTPPGPWAGDPAHAATGGISRQEAARRLGVEEESGSWHAVYAPALTTWFFTTPQGPARALERVPVSNPTLPPKAPPGFEPRPWQWTPRALPAMDVIAADELGREGEGGTRLRLAPAIFRDLFPHLTDGNDTIDVPKEKLWAVLARARERGLRLRVRVDHPSRPEARAVLSLVAP